MPKHWYRVDIVEGKDSRILIGTSDLDPAQLAKQLRSGEYLVLNDLSYRDNLEQFDISYSVACILEEALAVGGSYRSDGVGDGLA